MAMYATLLTQARAELTAQFTVGAGTKNLVLIKAIVVCSQYPELNARRLRGFLKEATGIRTDFFIQDGPFQFLDPAPNKERVQKMLLVAAEQEPSQLVKECVQETVPFGEKVFRQASDTWARIGKPLPANVPNSSIMGPVKTSRNYSYINDDSGKREWVIVTIASEFSGSPYEINNTMIGLFDLDHKVCQGNRFCLAED
ncbi:hypothetical protein [Leisingera methylohalidivorans]|uniref:Uncharacterized protein n=1 Tax=Leisingera methylohalidivorans DSM 14336 TaxID=999552 RepID=V9W151_9RHOB|nr:hypothetical protein [Leisingera methylohalidivorans]AHD02892.1 hypothetical protein METH_04845 [Leisingera methylohalidivorans DSM 14336]